MNICIAIKWSEILALIGFFIWLLYRVVIYSVDLELKETKETKENIKEDKTKCKK